jgi:hypothetical protein
MQTARRQHAFQVFERCPRNTVAGNRFVCAYPASDAFLVLRRPAVRRENTAGLAHRWRNDLFVGKRIACCKRCRKTESAFEKDTAIEDAVAGDDAKINVARFRLAAVPE